MIKASARTDTGHHLVFGLSYQNLRRLRQGEPISIDLKELGMSGSTCLIFAGKDEASMAKALKELIGPQTKVIDRLPTRWPLNRE